MDGEEIINELGAAKTGIKELLIDSARKKVVLTALCL